MSPDVAHRVDIGTSALRQLMRAKQKCSPHLRNGTFDPSETLTAHCANLYQPLSKQPVSADTMLSFGLGRPMSLGGQYATTRVHQTGRRHRGGLAIRGGVQGERRRRVAVMMN